MTALMADVTGLLIHLCVQATAFRPALMQFEQMGQVYYRIFKPKWFPEEQDDFVLPDRYKRDSEKPKNLHRDSSHGSSQTLVEENQQQPNDIESGGEQGKKNKEKEDKPEDDPNVVTWYGDLE